ncbi:hypothetical protein HPB50_011676 [Hyalomma asiaticum]|uniref:Uncharacterized protein n=1 Tax=Hyalomma asiaticum TaxID=266040 RepID=A0ACB7T412_HYAAI|nr:hypothetical protein HPB50_011676 [Hyalomma asiaticum]
MIANLMENLRDINTRPVYKVLVFAFPNIMWAQETVERLRYMPVDILIGVSHQTVDDKNFADCIILPPTFMDSPGPSYPYSLRHWAEVFEEIGKAALPTTLALSVGLYIRRYQPRYPGEVNRQPVNYTFGNDCTNFPHSQMLPASEVCEDKWRYTFYYDDHYHAVSSSNKRELAAFTQDAGASFREKLCKLKEEHWSLKFTVAAMGLEFADSQKMCYATWYRKIDQLRKVVDFLNQDFTSQASYNSCITSLIFKYDIYRKQG